VVLFGTLVIWALISIVTLNRRDGEWNQPEPVALIKDVALVAIGFVVFVLVILVHEYLAGVPAFPAF